MTYLKYAFSIFMVSFLLTSCNDEDTGIPSITFDAPATDYAVELNKAFTVSYTVSDEGAIADHTLDILDGNGEPVETIPMEAKTGAFDKSITISENIKQPVVIKVTVEDEAGNIGAEAIELGILGVDMVFRLKYNGEDLNFFDRYEYPSGQAMNFTRFSTYISDLTFGETVVKDIDYLRVQKEVGDTSTTEIGIYEINTVPSGSYTTVKFKFGVPASLNAMKPADFLSAHPLSRADEYWNSWSSYIFTKIEGNIDFDENTDLEKPIALHLGFDDALMEFSFPVNIDLTEERQRLYFDIDLYKLFAGENGVYDISISSTHSMQHLPNIVELAGNLERAVTLTTD